MSVHKLTAGDGYTYLTRQVAAHGATNRGYSGLGDYYSNKGETPGVWLGRGLAGLTEVTSASRAPMPGPRPHPASGAPVEALLAPPEAPRRVLGGTAEEPVGARVAEPVGGRQEVLFVPDVEPVAMVGAQVSERQMLSLFGQGRHPDADAIAGLLHAQGATGPEADRAGRLGSPYRVDPGGTPFAVRSATAFRAYNTARDLPGSTAVPEADRAWIRTELATEMFAEEHGRPPVDARELSGQLARLSRQRTTAVAGYDLTFSPVKSVSTLWAVAGRDVAAVIAQSHADAVTDTVGWLEDHATYTRRGRNGVAQVEVRGLLAAAFTHRDSRSGDPDLHTHVAVSNKVQTHDGRWLALDGRAVFRNAVAASERYNTRLEALLTERLGVTFADRDPGNSTLDPALAPGVPGAGKRAVREIVGVDGPLTRAWSSRRAAIEARRAVLSADFQRAHGRPPTAKESLALAQQANLATRADKHEPRSELAQRFSWRREAEQVLGGPDALAGYVAGALGTADLTVAARPVPAGWAEQTAPQGPGHDQPLAGDLAAAPPPGRSRTPRPRRRDPPRRPRRSGRGGRAGRAVRRALDRPGPGPGRDARAGVQRAGRAAGPARAGRLAALGRHLGLHRGRVHPVHLPAGAGRRAAGVGRRRAPRRPDPDRRAGRRRAGGVRGQRDRAQPRAGRARARPGQQPGPGAARPRPGRDREDHRDAGAHPRLDHQHQHQHQHHDHRGDGGRARAVRGRGRGAPRGDHQPRRQPSGQGRRPDRRRSGAPPGVGEHGHAGEAALAGTAQALADPATRVKDAADRYCDALAVASEQVLGAERMKDIDREAEQYLPGLTGVPAWPTLRAHLALRCLHGTPATDSLRHAASDPGALADALDPAAVLDYRLDSTGQHSTRQTGGRHRAGNPDRTPGTAPLGWLPPIPSAVAGDQGWGRYLRRRHQQLGQACAELRALAVAWTPTTAPTWAVPLLADSATTAGLATASPPRSAGWAGWG